MVPVIASKLRTCKMFLAVGVDSLQVVIGDSMANYAEFILFSLLHQDQRIAHRKKSRMKVTDIERCTLRTREGSSMDQPTRLPT
jgi:hypothetical protein